MVIPYSVLQACEIDCLQRAALLACECSDPAYPAQRNTSLLPCTVLNVTQGWQDTMISYHLL